MKILILLFYFIFLNLYSKSFEVEIFFSINPNDIDIIGSLIIPITDKSKILPTGKTHMEIMES